MNVNELSFFALINIR